MELKTKYNIGDVVRFRNVIKGEDAFGEIAQIRINEDSFGNLHVYYGIQTSVKYMGDGDPCELLELEDSKEERANRQYDIDYDEGEEAMWITNVYTEKLKNND